MRHGNMDTQAMLSSDDYLDTTDEEIDAEVADVEVADVEDLTRDLSDDSADDSVRGDDTEDVIPLETVTEMVEDTISSISRAATTPEITTRAVRLLRTSTEEHVSKMLATANRLSRHAGRDHVVLADLNLARELASLWDGQQQTQAHAATEITHSTRFTSDSDSVSTDSITHENDDQSSSIVWPEDNRSGVNNTTEDEQSTSDATSSDNQMPMSNFEDIDPESSNVEMSSFDGNASGGDDFAGWFPASNQGSSQDGDIPPNDTTTTNKKRKVLPVTDEDSDGDMIRRAKRAKTVQ
ncbi:hypothetical protein K4K49_003253 [Colletotrichum sp. SAR 10_70]|nr:hypothetical protein K4K50_002507 [Colletotrichum sp. SAR 10_71]KAI8173029.1 hypothetical protein K4K49_003253 [Colletotrichum sp. SAR 10_70]